jgi:hypothetical protein
MSSTRPTGKGRQAQAQHPSDIGNGEEAGVGGVGPFDLSDGRVGHAGTFGQFLLRDAIPDPGSLDGGPNVLPACADFGGRGPSSGWHG